MGLKNVTLSLTTATQTIYTCPAGREASVYGIVISNNSSTSAQFTLRYYQISQLSLNTLATNYTVAARTEYTWPRPINCTGGDYVAISASRNTALVLQTAIYERSGN